VKTVSFVLKTLLFLEKKKMEGRLEKLRLPRPYIL
jgi:hypothetical protein